MKRAGRGLGVGGEVGGPGGGRVLPCVVAWYILGSLKIHVGFERESASVIPDNNCVQQLGEVLFTRLSRGG